MTGLAELALVAAVAAACDLGWTSASFGATLRPPTRISVVVAHESPAALYPGGSAEVWATLINDTARQRRIDPATIKGHVSDLPRGCLASWFTFAADSRPVVLAGRGGTASIRGTLRFVDAAVDQSACAGAAPKLSLRPEP